MSRYITSSIQFLLLLHDQRDLFHNRDIVHTSSVPSEQLRSRAISIIISPGRNDLLRKCCPSLLASPSHYAVHDIRLTCNRRQADMHIPTSWLERLRLVRSVPQASYTGRGSLAPAMRLGVEVRTRAIEAGGRLTSAGIRSLDFRSWIQPRAQVRHPDRNIE